MLNIIVIRKYITLFLAIIFIIWGFNIVVKNQKSGGIVKAFGPLKVSYSATPMFSDTNLSPGKSMSRSITIENTDNTAHSIGIKTDNLATQNLSLANIIDITITRDGMPIYGLDSPTGKKNLANFFTDDVVSLNKLLPGGKGIYDFILRMDETAGDEYQGQLVKFDLLTGIDKVRFMTIPTIVPRPTFKTMPTFAPFPTLRPF